jgi:HTH-type transcriptional regulator/antitoxin HigA
MMTDSPNGARAVMPGRILSRELEARGWQQRDLAAIMNRPVQAINEIVHGQKQITPETARELGAALGTSPELWLNLETNYRLQIAKRESREKEIGRRGKFYALAPIAELQKRGWIKSSQDINKLEESLLIFLGMSSIDAPLRLSANLRRSNINGPELAALNAWVKRVEHLASKRQARTFNRTRLTEHIPELLALATRGEDVKHVRDWFENMGVRFVIVPHLAKTYLDGAALDCDGMPVIALTLRHDRIDAFWFTLMHELAHIVANHDGILLDNFEDEEMKLQKHEVQANKLARDWLIPSVEYENFVRHLGDHVSRSKVEDFARSINRHPGIVLGRLQYENYVPYKNMRALLSKVSPNLQGQIDQA